MTRLARLQLQNIGTFVQADVVLRDGVTIIAGDIGVGKTMLLRGLTAALIGADRGQAAALLRWGTDKGRMAITLEHDGKPLGISRALNRDGATVNQNEVLVNDGKPRIMSPTVAHAKLFAKLLGFPVPYSARHDVYNHVFAVPQEGMRAVLDETSRNRVEVLRRVFGVEKFAVAADNGAALSRELDSRLRESAPQVEQLQVIKQRRSEARAKVEELRGRVAKLVDAERTLNRAVTKLEEKCAGNQESRTELAKLHERRRMIVTSSHTSTHREAVRAAQKSIEHWQSVVVNAAQQDVRRVKLTQLLHKAELEQAAVAHKVKSAQRRLKKLRALKGECSLCGSVLSRKASALLVTAQQARLTDLQTKAERAVSEFSRLSKSIAACGGIDAHAQAVIKLDRAQAIYNQASESLAHAKSNKEQLEKIEQQIIDVTAAVEKQSNYAEHLSEARESLNTSLQQRSVAQTQLADQQERIDEANRDYEKVKAQVAARTVYITRGRWIKSRFVPEMVVLEQEQLSRARAALEHYFSQWLRTLLPSGEFTASIAADCSPEIAKRGFTVPSLQFGLSGGQRTAVGLAYSLATRSAYHELYGNDTVPDFLILDEPTSGFSSVQIGNLREVIGALEVRQLFLITHEVEQLSSVADSIINLTLNDSGCTIIECR
jgi:DNA repair exonuclease SbcCD ATPase subunit